MEKLRDKILTRKALKTKQGNLLLLESGNSEDKIIPCG